MTPADLTCLTEGSRGITPEFSQGSRCGLFLRDSGLQWWTAHDSIEKAPPSSFSRPVLSHRFGIFTPATTDEMRLSTLSYCISRSVCKCNENPSTFLLQGGGLVWRIGSHRYLEWINSVCCPHWSISEQTRIPDKSQRTRSLSVRMDEMTTLIQRLVFRRVPGLS